MSTEFDPVRMVLDQDDQLIMAFSSNGHAINLKWDNTNKIPYFQFSNLPTAPKLSAGYSVLYREGQEYYSSLWALVYDDSDTTKEKYYFTGANNIDPFFSVNESDNSMTCFRCVVSMNDGAQDVVWRFNFDITRDRSVSGSDYNYVTLTGFKE